MLVAFDFDLFPFVQVHLHHLFDTTSKIQFRTSNTLQFSTKSFHRFFQLFLSLPFSFFAYPTPFCNLADSGHHSSVRINNERTRERTNFKSGCPKGRKPLGRGRRVKGWKIFPNLMSYPPVFTSFEWFSLCFIFYYWRARFLGKNSSQILSWRKIKKRIDTWVLKRE